MPIFRIVTLSLENFGILSIENYSSAVILLNIAVCKFVLFSFYSRMYQFIGDVSSDAPIFASVFAVFEPDPG